MKMCWRLSFQYSTLSTLGQSCSLASKIRVVGGGIACEVSDALDSAGAAGGVSAFMIFPPDELHLLMG
jgi:hypothetical protein